MNIAALESEAIFDLCNRAERGTPADAEITTLLEQRPGSREALLAVVFFIRDGYLYSPEDAPQITAWANDALKPHSAIAQHWACDELIRWVKQNYPNSFDESFWRQHRAEVLADYTP